MASLPPKSKAPVTPIGLSRRPRQVRVDVVQQASCAFTTALNQGASGSITPAGREHRESRSGTGVSGAPDTRESESGPTGHPGYYLRDHATVTDIRDTSISGIRSTLSGSGMGASDSQRGCFLVAIRGLRSARCVQRYTGSKLPMVPKQSLLPVGPCSPCPIVAEGLRPLS